MTRFLAPYLIGSAALAAIVGFIFFAGIRHSLNKTEAQNAKDYIEGTEDVRDATSDLPDDDAGNIDWLLNF